MRDILDQHREVVRDVYVVSSSVQPSAIGALCE
jgi:hypothetical protein